MPFIVYSDDNATSRNIGRAIVASSDFEELDTVSGYRHFRSGRVDALEIRGSILDCSFLDRIISTDFIVFVCSHSSSGGIASFTTHHEGNWSMEAKLGGKPKELSVAAPGAALAVMEGLKKNNDSALQVIYEATHHGPLLKTPSFFVEVGGTNEALESKKYSGIVARSVMDALSENETSPDCVLGLGGMHYAEKFTRVAFGKGCAFSHIMPKYHIAEIDMLQQAVERSSPRPEKAMIEWKSIKASDREKIIAELNRIGIDYERV